MVDSEDGSTGKDLQSGDPERGSMPSADPSKDRMTHDRKFRDIFWLLLFIAFWCGMVAIGVVAVTRGEPRALLYGLDYRGNFCGADNGNGFDLSDFKYRFWVNPKELRDLQSQSTIGSSLDTLDNGKSICLQECPSVDMNSTAFDQISWICNYPDFYGNGSSVSYPFSNWTLEEWAEANYDYYDLLNAEQKNSSLAMRGPCYPIFYESAGQYYSCQLFGSPNEGLVEAFNTEATSASHDIFCSPGPDCDSLSTSASTLIYDGITNAFLIFTRYLADIWLAWLVILVAGVIIPLVLSVLWIIIMRYSIGVLAWIILIGLNLCNIGITLFFFIKAGYIGSSPIEAGSGTELIPSTLDATSTNEDVLLGFGIASAVITALFLILTLLMIRRVRLAVNVIKVATQSLNQHPMLLGWPIIPFLFFIILTAFWLAFGIYLVSAGEPQQEKLESDGGTCIVIEKYASNPNCNPDESCQCGYEYVFDEGLVYLIIYYFFGFLWTSQFIVAVSVFVIGSTVAMFYWSGGDRSRQPGKPIWISFKRSMTYHVGSLALGSLIVAIIVFIRMLLRYMERRMKTWKTSNPATRWLICCVDCCLWLIQKFVEFTNRNAYIVIAVDGCNFCVGAFKALKVIVTNVLRVAAVNIIGDTFLLIGKSAITAFCGFVAFLMLQDSTYTQGSRQISSPLLPVIAVVLGSFAIASVFMAVVEMAVDSVLLCYCMDCEENGGTAMHAPELLLGTLEEAEKEASRKKGSQTTQGTGFDQSN